MKGSEPFLTTASRPRHNDKHTTKELLRAQAIKAPRGAQFESHKYRELLDYFRSFEGAGVLKPSGLNAGRGVTTGISNEDELKQAYAPIAHRRTILEQHIDGDEHRLLVIGGRMVAAVRRTPASVRGDGVKSIQELIDEKNTVRLNHPVHKHHCIEIDGDLLHFLQKQGRSLSDVPGDGKKVVLRGISSVSRGGDAQDITDKVHPSFISVAERVWNSFPDRVIYGVDLIAADITRPCDDQDYGVIEVNNRPMLTGLHGCPTIGKPRDVITPLLDYLFGEETTT